MKEFVLESPIWLSNVEHFTASFTDFENDRRYWAPICQCGSKTDAITHECLALKAERETKNAN